MKKDFEKDKTARAALEKTVGKPLAEFEADWKAWMMKRVAPPIRPGPNDPYLGVVFGSANDGLQVRTVVAAGPVECHATTQLPTSFALDGEEPVIVMVTVTVYVCRVAEFDTSPLR